MMQCSINTSVVLNGPPRLYQEKTAFEKHTHMYYIAAAGRPKSCFVKCVHQLTSTIKRSLRYGAPYLLPFFSFPISLMTKEFRKRAKGPSFGMQGMT
jgi:hypothetical protein